MRLFYFIFHTAYNILSSIMRLFYFIFHTAYNILSFHYILYFCRIGIISILKLYYLIIYFVDSTRFELRSQDWKNGENQQSITQFLVWYKVRNIEYENELFSRISIWYSCINVVINKLETQKSIQTRLYPDSSSVQNQSLIDWISHDPFINYGLDKNFQKIKRKILEENL